MKVLVIDNIPSSKQGGMEWSTRDLSQGLASRGHKLHLAYREPGDFLPIYRTFCQSIVQTRFFERYRGNKFTIFWSLLRSVLPVLRTQPEVIYIQKYQNSFFAGILARIMGVPLVCHLRCFPPAKEFNHQFQIGLKSVTRFITVSEATRTAYLRAGLDLSTVEVVYNGIDLQRFTLGNDRDRTRAQLDLPPDAFVVLYAGRLDPPKNIEMLIRAFAQMGLPAEKAQLLIVGSPVNHKTKAAGEQYQQALQALCHSEGIDNRVHWLGRRSDLPELYRAADVTVLPSLLPDTFGRVLAESMACGTPALGLKYGGIPEVLAGEFQKFQFEVGDIPGLANHLQSLQGWQQQDPELALRCRAYVEKHFSVQRTIEEVEKALQKAIAIGPKRLGPSSQALAAWAENVSRNPEAFVGMLAMPR